MTAMRTVAARTVGGAPLEEAGGEEVGPGGAAAQRAVAAGAAVEVDLGGGRELGLRDGWRLGLGEGDGERAHHTSGDEPRYEAAVAERSKHGRVLLMRMWESE
jgi:hypothetical protein